jgi:2-keto-3-deoxy-L-rhamnonate aldolase RhmA
MIFQNTMKQALKQGKVVFGPMISEIRSPGLAVMFARCGFDYFFLDTEHSCFGLETLSDYVMAARAAGIPMIVRPPTRTSHEALSRPLDIGASGLLVPQIQSVQDARNVVQWTRYQPLGERGMALERQHTHFEGGNAVETMVRLNEEVLIALQIEHREAIDNLEAILAVPGIDAAFVGPSDLSASLGKPGQADDPVVVQAIQKVIDVSRKHGVIPGIHTSTVEAAKQWIGRGMRMIGYATDIKLIQQVCRQSVKELKALLPAAR